MPKNYDDMYSRYEELMDLEGFDLHRFQGISLNNDEDDGDTFITSKEIIQKKELIKRNTEGTRVLDSPPDEHVHFKRYSKARQHKYTAKEMEIIEDSCRATIVHDYGENDWYHMSDEYREKHDYLSDISLKLGSLRRSYSLPSQYINAMRVVFEAWSMLAEKNYIHTKEEFFEMVSEGTIVSPRIIMPKLKKMDSYNLEVLIQYISNPEMDATSLDPIKKKPSDDFFNDEEESESEEEEMRRILSPEEVQYILEHMEDPEKIKFEEFKSKYIKGYDQRNGLKRRKGESKKDHRIREDLAMLLRKIQNNDHYKSYGNSYMVTHSLFDPEKKEKSFWDRLKFNGSWANDDDVKLLELAIIEEMSKQHIPREKHLTYGDKWLSEFFSTLEDNGVNTVDLRRRMSYTDGDVKKRKIKSERRDNKKKEAQLLQRITKLNGQSKFKKIANKAEKELSQFREEDL